VLVVIFYFLSQTWVFFLAIISLILLYWHFLKQSYGAALWMGRKSSLPFSEKKKQLLLLTLLLWGVYSFLSFETGTDVVPLFGITTPLLNIHSRIVFMSMGLAYSSTIFFLAWLLMDWLREGHVDFDWKGLIPIFATFAWFEPRLGTSPVRILLPVFHALQYFPFPFRVFLTHQSRHQVPRTRAWLNRFLILIGLVIAGYMIFILIPQGIGYFFSAKDSRVFSLVTLFINIHHYGIDAVIWRLSDPEVRKRLFE
jgi:hypothetical protein